MAINSVVLDVVLKVAAKLPAPRRMLCLGYPDMLVTQAQLAALCGAEAMAKVGFREDSAAILRWHSLAGHPRGNALVRRRAGARGAGGGRDEALRGAAGMADADQVPAKRRAQGLRGFLRVPRRAAPRRSSRSERRESARRAAAIRRPP